MIEARAIERRDRKRMRGRDRMKERDREKERDIFASWCECDLAIIW